MTTYQSVERLVLETGTAIRLVAHLDAISRRQKYAETAIPATPIEVMIEQTKLGMAPVLRPNAWHAHRTNNNKTLLIHSPQTYHIKMCDEHGFDFLSSWQPRRRCFAHRGIDINQRGHPPHGEGNSQCNHCSTKISNNKSRMGVVIHTTPSKLRAWGRGRAGRGETKNRVMPILRSWPVTPMCETHKLLGGSSPYINCCPASGARMSRWRQKGVRVPGRAVA